MLQKESHSRLRVRKFSLPLLQVYITNTHMSHTNQILFSFNNSRGNHFLCVSVAMILENMDNLNLAKFMLLIYHDNVLVPLVVTWQTITSYSWNKTYRRIAAAWNRTCHWITKMFRLNILSCNTKFQRSNLPLYYNQKIPSNSDDHLNHCQSETLISMFHCIYATMTPVDVSVTRNPLINLANNSLGHRLEKGIKCAPENYDL